MVELTGIIFILSIKILVGCTFAQPLRAINKEMIVWLNSHGFVAARELDHLVKSMYSKVLVLTS